MKKVKSVDEYVSLAPKDVQVKLKELRHAIKETAPNATEKISYAMPFYDYKGRLVYFSFFKNHIGIYIPTPTLEDHAKDLEGYETAKATVRFPLDKDLPIALIKKLVKARVKWNEEHEKKK